MNDDDVEKWDKIRLKCNNRLKRHFDPRYGANYLECTLTDGRPCKPQNCPILTDQMEE